VYTLVEHTKYASRTDDH